MAILTFGKVENFTLIMFPLQSFLCFSLFPFNPFSWFSPLDIINNIGCAGQLEAPWLVKVIGAFSSSLKCVRNCFLSNLPCNWLAAMVSVSECILSLLMLLQCIWVVPQRKKPLAQRMRIENQQLWSLINHSAT